MLGGQEVDSGGRGKQLDRPKRRCFRLSVSRRHFRTVIRSPAKTRRDGPGSPRRQWANVHGDWEQWPKYATVTLFSRLWGWEAYTSTIRGGQAVSTGRTRHRGEFNNIRAGPFQFTSLERSYSPGPIAVDDDSVPRQFNTTISPAGSLPRHRGRAAVVFMNQADTNRRLEGGAAVD